MKKYETIHMLFGLLLGLIGVVLMFVWYDWKLALIIFLLMWSNNISMRLSK